MHAPYTAYYVGDRESEEFALFDDLQLLVDVRCIELSNAYQTIVQSTPDYVILPNVGSTAMLRLFRLLQSQQRICVMVIEDQQISAFTGRSLKWRCTSPRTVRGLEALMSWAKWPLPINRKINRPLTLQATG
jgi:hypothetical protein